jgi:hypothetical protein
VKIAPELQLDLNIVPTRMFWKKVKTDRGEFTLLLVTTPVGSWGFLMDAPMTTDLRKGMEKMESPLEVATKVPPPPEKG